MVQPSLLEVESFVPDWSFVDVFKVRVNEAACVDYIAVELVGFVIKVDIILGDLRAETSKAALIWRAQFFFVCLKNLSKGQKSVLCPSPRHNRYKECPSGGVSLLLHCKQHKKKPHFLSINSYGLAIW